MVGISRITDFKHHPTDVIFGAIIGFLSAISIVSFLFFKNLIQFIFFFR